MPANYVLLERIELSATTTSVVFNNIPQSGYTDLKLVCSSRATNNNGQYIAMQINALTGNISAKTMYGTGSSSVSSYSSSAQTDAYGDQPDSNFTASTYANTEFYITNYSSTSQYKCIYMDGVTEGNSSTAWQLEMGSRLSSNNAAVTSLTLTVPNSGSFAEYSTFSLYGLAATGTSPVIAPKASGGNITTDGTYWYHTFLSSGTFTPSRTLSADVLVIAGGASGGASYGGGGGAGGVCNQTSRSIIAANYTVQIGAGGATTTSQYGINGNNSNFDTIIALGGGGGGFWATASYAGLAGGSGGGSGMGASNGQTGAGGGAATQGSSGGATGYGNAGGNGYRAPGDAAYLGGGGGGAGASGGNSSTSATWTGGAGGAGLNTWSSWATATGTGVSGYYAGGGGGGADNTGTVPGAGGAGGGGAGGGNGTGTNIAPGAGTANTGSGGGGRSGSPGAGGSGIVIIRYAMA